MHSIYPDCVEQSLGAFRWKHQAHTCLIIVPEVRYLFNPFKQTWQYLQQYVILNLPLQYYRIHNAKCPPYKSLTMRFLHIVLSKLHEKLEVHNVRLTVLPHDLIHLLYELEHDLLLLYQLMRLPHPLKSTLAPALPTLGYLHQLDQQIKHYLCVRGYDQLQVG